MTRNSANKFKGICYVCGKEVEVGKGHFQRDGKNHRWQTKHSGCKNKQINK